MRKRQERRSNRDAPRSAQKSLGISGGGSCRGRQDAAAAVGYRGFAGQGRDKLPRSAIDIHGRPIDAWRRPLRLRISQERFPPSGVGVWSDGRDGKPEEGSGDDITSWSER